MNNKKHNFNWIWVLGSAFFLVGTLLAVLLTIKYSEVKSLRSIYDANTKFVDFATSLSGTVGVLFSVSSIAFFVYTLYQTRQEMADNRTEMQFTREVMNEQKEQLKKQINETYFFNLINNHREFCKTLKQENSEGYKYIDDVYLDISDSLDTYLQCLLFGFDDYEETNLQPKMLSRKYHEFFNSWVPNVIQIIKFIKEQLNNEHNFHRTLFNSLNHQERFLLGYIITNERKKFSYEFTDNLKGYISDEIKYDYSSFFLNHDSYYDRYGFEYAPDIDIWSPERVRSSVPKMITDQEVFEATLKELATLKIESGYLAVVERKLLEIDSYDIITQVKIQNKGINDETYEESISKVNYKLNKQVTKNFSVNIDNFFDEYLVPLILKHEQQQEFNFKIYLHFRFHFKYLLRPTAFSVKHSLLVLLWATKRDTIYNLNISRLKSDDVSISFGD